MGLLRTLERKVTRPLGRGLKSVAPIAGGIIGGAVGGPLGAAAGSALGGMAKRGKFDLSDGLLDAGSGLLMNGLASRVGLTGKLAGKLAGSGIPGIADGAASQYLNGASGQLAGTLAGQGAGSAVTSAASRAVGGAGGALKSVAGGVLSDPMKMQAAGAALNAGAQLYTGQQRDQLEREQWEYQRSEAERRRREEEEGAAALAPMGQQLLAGLQRRIGAGGTGYVAGYLDR